MSRKKPTLTHEDHMYRLNAMLEADDGTWDLSDNDKAAIRNAVDIIERLDDETIQRLTSKEPTP